MTETHDLVRTIHALREEIDGAAIPSGEPSSADADSFTRLHRESLTELDALEDLLRQKRARVWQDTANFEPLLDDQFAWLASYVLSAEARPPDVAYERYAELESELAQYRSRLDALVQGNVTAFRAIARDREN